MNVIITKDNIDEFRDSIQDNVTWVKWEAGKLDGYVLEKFPNLTKLDCSNNGLESLKGLDKCPHLHFLNCSGNKLTSLSSVENCLQLQNLDCMSNQISSLSNLQNCTQLRYLNCSLNELISLQGIEKCSQLKQLDIHNNRLVQLNPIVYLRHLELEWVQYDNNPLDTQTIQVQRFLDIYRTKKSVYFDCQNILNTTIQKTICDSIQSLLLDPKPDFSIQIIIDSTVHSIHLLTYQDLLSYIWSRITRSDKSKELFKILEKNKSKILSVSILPKDLIGLYPHWQDFMMTFRSKYLIVIDIQINLLLIRRKLSRKSFSESIKPWINILNDI